MTLVAGTTYCRPGSSKSCRTSAGGHALSRYCVDTDAGIISVRVSVVELARGPLVTGPTKSAAGNRDVTIPAFLLPEVVKHLDDFTAADPQLR